MQKLADGIYLETGSNNSNVGLITTSEGGILVNTLFLPSEMRDWAHTIRRIAGDTVLFMILTDQYLDHVLGTSSFDCPIVAHELAWKELRNYDDETFYQRLAAHVDMLDLDSRVMSELIRPRVPELIVSSELRMYKGQREIRLIHLGGHTPASIGVYLPQQRMLFSGDVVVCGQHPFMGQANTKQWIEALEMIRAMDVKMIIPGHGPICGMEVDESTTLKVEQDEQVIYFCSEHCRKKFLGASPPAPAARPVPRGLKSLLPHSSPMCWGPAPGSWPQDALLHLRNTRFCRRLPWSVANRKSSPQCMAAS